MLHVTGPPQNGPKAQSCAATVTADTTANPSSTSTKSAFDASTVVPRRRAPMRAATAVKPAVPATAGGGDQERARGR